MKPIRGAGGGGKSGAGGGRSPVESADSLRSRQNARVIDLVSEGEVSGLLDGLKSVYLNNTPVQNADGSYNFSGVTLETREGTQSQGYIPGFPSVEAETAVGVEMVSGVPVVRSISNANANAIRVTVSVPRLTYQDPSSGDLSGTDVRIAVDLQTNGGGYVNVVDDTIAGKTTSRYQRGYRIELSGTGPWDIRVRRLSADAVDARYSSSTFWDSYTEIIDAKLKYPNSALMAISVDAENFNSIPNRGYEMKGIKVRVPSNYDPVTRIYTGVWDGTFTNAWTDNPAWCFYDLLVESRYGLGDFISAAQVDKWALYEIAQYCDELVDDGFGGTEPRFTCSLYLQTREEAYNVITTFASIFCGQSYWGGDSIVTTQDAPGDPVALFTPANVINTETGPFSYSGSSIKSRHTVALVAWNDPADRYRQKIEYVEDAEGIAKFGIVQTEVVALGCTSRGQAHRYGRRILYAERMETEVISFRAGLDGLTVAPGQIIQTSDPIRAGVRVGGRTLSATTTHITLDGAVTMAGAIYTLWATLPDGTVESRTVVTPASTTAALEVSPAFSAAPDPYSIWVLASADLVPETWRVLSVTEADKTQAEITALAYREDKYLAIEQGLILEPLAISVIDVEQPTPTNMTVTEELYLVTQDVVGTRLSVSWSGTAKYFELQYRKVNGNWQNITERGMSVDIQPVDAGMYEFSLVAVAASGRRSIPRTATVEVLGKSAAPSALTGFTIIKSSGFAMASWVLSSDLDVRISGRVVVRHTPEVSGATWEQGVVLDEFNGDAVNGVLPLMTGTYMAKARDSSGNYSDTAVLYVATEGMVTGFVTVGSISFAPTFTGTKTNVGVVDSRLQLSSDELFDAAELIDSASDIDGGSIASAGECDFTDVLDLTTSAVRRVQATINAISFDVGDYIDSDEDIDSGEDIDGAVINDCDATVYLATTPDNPAGSPVWSDWQPFFVGDFEFRALKFRLGLTSGLVSHNIAISALSVSAKVPA